MGPWTNALIFPEGPRAAGPQRTEKRMHTAQRAKQRAARPCAAALALLAAAAAPAAARAEDGGTIVATKTLPNGMEVIVEESHGAPVVAVQMWVRVGSADEAEEDAGLAHVLEHMLFKGTKRRGVGGIAKEIDALGGDINAYTSYDQTVYHVVVASRYAERGLDIIGDATLNSTLDAGELARETRVVLEELYRTLDSPASRSWNQLMATAYGVHPYRRPIIGYAKTIEAMTREQLAAFYKRWYVPNNMTLVIAGDVRAGEMIEAAEKMFAPYPMGPDPHRGLPREPEQTAPRFAEGAAPIRNTLLKAGFHIPGLGQEDSYALDVLSVILGSGKSSRLYRRVKDEQGLARSASAYALTPKWPGLFTLAATVDGADPARTTEAMLAETYRLRREPPTAEEVRKAQRNLEADFVFARETAQGRAQSLGSSAVTAGDLEFERRYLERVRAVTPEEVVRVARKYLAHANLSMSLLQPKDKEKPVTEAALRAAAQRAWDAARAAEAKTGAPSARAQEAAPGDAAGRAPAQRRLDAPAEAERAPERAPAAVAAAPSADRARVRALPGGGRLIVRRTSGAPTFAMSAAFLGGVRYEKPSEEGLANMAAQMLTRGTARRSAREIAEEAERMAGQMAGFSGYNTFGLEAHFLARDFDAALDLFADALTASAFPPEEFEKVRADVLTDIKTREDNPSHVAMNLAREGLYGGDVHPYGREVHGTAETVGALTPEDAARYVRAYAKSSNLVMAVVGDLDPEEVFAKARRALAPLMTEEPVPAPEIAPPAFPRKPRLQEARLDKEQTHIVIAYPGVRFGSPDRYALGVLSSAMRGMGGRLFLQLRDRQSLAYVVSAQNLSGVDPGMFYFYMASSPEKEGEALAGLMDQIAAIREEPMGAEELARAKTSAVGGYEIDLQSNLSQARDAAFNEIYGLGHDEFRRFAARTEAVTAEEVLAAARAYLDPERVVKTIVRGKAGPARGAPTPEAAPEPDPAAAGE